MDVVARRVGQAVDVPEPHLRRLTEFTRAADQLFGPFQPPRPLCMRRQFQPFVPVNIGRIRRLGHDLVAMPRLVRRRHDAGVMTSARQQEGHIGIDLIMNLVDGSPRPHVIPERADDKHRRVDVRE